MRLLPALAILVFVAAASRPARAAPLQQAPLISGIWSSIECEPWPGRPFARRELTISGTGYRLDVVSFADVKCTIPTLRTRYEGQFIVRSPSPLMPETWEVEFIIRQALLTPYVLNTAEFLNSAPRGTCGLETWFVGIEQELASTGGCLSVGINLRQKLVEYDIATVQANRLFLGQRPPDGGFLSTPERRPTVFGPPLLRTGDVLILLPPVGGDHSPAIALAVVGVVLLLGGLYLSRDRRTRRPATRASPPARINHHHD